MRGMIKKYKKEFFYITVIFVLWQLSLVPGSFGKNSTFWILNIAGISVLIVWVLTNYIENGRRYFSKYSDVLIKINLRQRFFSFFLTPIFLYVAVALYLYGVSSIALRQIVLIVGLITLYVLMLHIRASYEHVFTLERRTKFVFQLVDIVLFYIAVTGFVLLGTSDLMRVIGATLIGFVLLLHQLILSKQSSIYSLVILTLSTLLIFVSGLFFAKFSAVIFPLYMGVMFYLILSLWSVRLHGILKMNEYLPPILFSLMAFMILLSF